MLDAWRGGTAAVLVPDAGSEVAEDAGADAPIAAGANAVHICFDADGTTPIGPMNAQLRGLAVGETTVHVNAKRRSDGLSAQQGSIKVTIVAAREK